MMPAVQPLSVEELPSQARDVVSGSPRRAFGLGALAGFVGAGLAVVLLFWEDVLGPLQGRRFAGAPVVPQAGRGGFAGEAVAYRPARGSSLRMQAAGSMDIKADVVAFSWLELGQGNIYTKLTQLTGPAVQEVDVMTREMVTKGNDNFDQFVALIQNSDVAQMLQGPGEYTLLVPTNSAIASSRNMNVAIDPRLHVLKGRHSYDALKAGGQLETLAGTAVTYGKNMKTVKVNNAAVKAVYNAADHRMGKESTAFPFDVDCTNGVIHAIDEVIEP